MIAPRDRETPYQSSQAERSRFIHIVDSVEAEAAGTSYSVPRLCEALAKQGADAQLFSIGDSRVNRPLWRHEVFRQDFASVPVLSQMRFSRGLLSDLKKASRSASILHGHGLWLMSNIYPARVAAATGTPLVMSPRGMLGEAALRFSAHKKRLFWITMQSRALQAAKCIHATSEQEYQDIRAFGLTAPVAIIPNGIDIVPLVPKRPRADARRTVLFLGRIHPKKGIEQLTAAWKTICWHHPGWRLEIVGPLDDPYARELQRKLADVPQASVSGPLYGAQKNDAYRQADVFVLPSLNENFGMTVAEALAQETPVISTKGTPWAGLENYGCGWWVDHGVDALAVALDRAMATPQERLTAMGQAGRRWMERDFDWDAISACMESVYNWLCKKNSAPDCVVKY